MIHCQEHSTKLTKRLRDNKLKITAARLSLLDVFEHARKPLSVKEIREERPELKVDKVTLYRTIETLEKLGLIRQIQLKDRQAYFEINSAKHHHHLICKECGKLVDLPGCTIATKEKDLLKESGFARIIDHSLEFFGICNKCFNR